MSLRIQKFLNRSLTLASAAFVLHVGVAAAADPVRDIQPHSTVSLVGTAKAHDAPDSGLRDSRRGVPAADAQELARQLLLGNPSAHVADTHAIDTGHAGQMREFVQRSHSRAYDDPQVAAQLLLLGQHQRSQISPTGDKTPVVFGDAQLAAQRLLLADDKVNATAFSTERATR